MNDWCTLIKRLVSKRVGMNPFNHFIFIIIQKILFVYILFSQKNYEWSSIICHDCKFKPPYLTVCINVMLEYRRGKEKILELRKVLISHLCVLQKDEVEKILFCHDFPFSLSMMYWFSFERKNESDIVRLSGSNTQPINEADRKGTTR